MANPLDPKQTKAHCNTCGGERSHKVLYSEESSWTDDENSMSGDNKYEMLKCCGCDSVKLRHHEWSSEYYDDDGKFIPLVQYYPPAIFRPHPRWFIDLILEASIDDGNIHDLLTEIYIAIRNDQRALAAMGVRALLESIMIEKVGDLGSFSANIKAFETDGYVSHIQRERLETILEVGHAAMHRLYKPSKEDIITLVDITESVIESIYIHGKKVEKLKNGIPPRTPKLKR